MSLEPQVKSLSPSLLVSATYDGQKQTAVLKFYNPDSEKIVLWADEIGHKPYCYSKLNPDELSFLLERSDVIRIEPTKRKNFLKDTEETVSKILVTDPLAIGGTQTDKSIRNVIETWESDIKYYENYLYDRGLIVGKFYKVEDGKIVPHEFEITEEVNLAMKSLLLDVNTSKGIVNVKEFQENITQWAHILNQPIPKIRRLSFDIEVEAEIGRIPDPKIAEKRITAVGFDGSDGFKQVLVLRKPGSSDGKNELPPDVKITFYAESDEKKMIEDAFKIIADYPFVITFNGDDFDMPYMYNRAERLGIKNAENPLYMMRDSATLKHGVHIDLYRTMSNRSFQIYAFSHKYTDFSLNSVSKALLGEAKIDYGIELDKLENYQLANYCYNDARLTYKLTSFNSDLLMNLLVVVSRIARMPIDDIARMGVSQWIRSLLYYEHRQRNAMIPRRDELDAKSQGVMNEAIIKDKKYRGGLVVDPTEGIHFDVTVMDFASLYPSIIKVRNLSYETVRCSHEECKKNTIPDTNHWVCTKYNGLTSMIIGSLRDLRVNYYKSLAKRAKTQEQKEQYTVVSQALKVILNASYGVMGAEIFPLYFLPAAEATTAVGRYIIMETIKKCQSNGIEVLYGDSVLPDTPITIRRKDGMVDIVPIESLMPSTVKNTRYDKFGDIDVLTENGFTKIKHVYRHKVKKKGYRILTRKGFVECTEDHSLVINGKETKPSDLRVGDRINIIPFEAESKIKVHADLGWLFGFFIAEGTSGVYEYGKRIKYSWRMVNQDRQLLQKAQRIMRENLGFDTSIIDIRKSSATYGLIPRGDHKLIVDYFRAFCYIGDEKCVPQIILNADVSAKKAFLSGLMGGNTDKNGLATLDQIHKTVLAGVISILEQFGLEYSLQIRKDKKNVCRLRLIRDKNDSGIKQSDMIKKIEPFNISGYVYDLETRSHHFCGGLGNVLLHNTDSLFIKNPTQAQIHKVIEDTKAEQGVDLEIDKEYRYVVLSNRKKNYLGVTKDGKVDVKGLTGKKSHTPPFIKNLFYELLQILSKVETSKDFEEAKKQISEKISDVAVKVKEKKIPIGELAFNVMISKAPNEYDKTVPQHIRAAKLLEQHREIKRGDIISYVKILNKPGVKPVEMAKPDEIDSAKYMEFMESTLDQITSSMDLDFDKMVGRPKQTGLDQFFWS
ncbi:DNA-directed DNA polymerase I [Candidatus Nitrosotenuis cloacae]|uniref:DNA-directed DNA polymerase I n=1 Tax=Candidatus Nitrosotenuis cloacae TaxID=1603555 RepID=UPI003B969C60